MLDIRPALSTEYLIRSYNEALGEWHTTLPGAAAITDTIDGAADDVLEFIANTDGEYAPIEIYHVNYIAGEQSDVTEAVMALAIEKWRATVEAVEAVPGLLAQFGADMPEFDDDDHAFQRREYMTGVMG